jgi:hypothetical protein
MSEDDGQRSGAPRVGGVRKVAAAHGGPGGPRTKGARRAAGGQEGRSPVALGPLAALGMEGLSPPLVVRRRGAQQPAAQGELMERTSAQVRALLATNARVLVVYGEEGARLYCEPS